MAAMSRAFWFAAGAVSGVYTLVKVRRTAQNFTPDGIAARVAALGAGARVFRDEVATGMAEREHELRVQFRLPPPGVHLIEPRPSAEPRRESSVDGNR
jgi:hypothetical protein